MERQPEFIKCNDDILITTRHIRWIYNNKKEECLSICTRPLGCYIDDTNLLQLCKNKEPEAYEKYSRFFK